ncbi:MAG TPA: hypothetical protein VMV49_14785 [Candidatus Deferrimicrobium sp.]|nr:hypothetical protein [Candidatus Deferrimicrobium sp.]
MEGNLETVPTLLPIPIQELAGLVLWLRTQDVYFLVVNQRPLLTRPATSRVKSISVAEKCFTEKPFSLVKSLSVH